MLLLLFGMGGPARGAPNPNLPGNLRKTLPANFAGGKTRIRDFSRAQVLFSQASAPDRRGRVRRRRILREASLKYPLIRVDELVQLAAAPGASPNPGGNRTGELVLSQKAMVADHILVKLRAGMGEKVLEKLNRNHGAKLLRKMRAPGFYLVALNQYSEPEAIEQAVSAYAAETSYVSSAGPDYLRSVSQIPDDTNFAPLWALHNTGQLGGTPDADIDATEAWDLTTGSRSVRIAIIDSGIDYNHPDLAANIWSNPGETPGNHRDDDHNGFIDDIHGWNFAYNNNDPLDDEGHGTHTAGIAGAVGNNATGVVGVNWQVSLVALKFIDASGSGYDSDAIECIQYAIDNGIKITSNSWGGTPFSQQLKDEIAAANQAGVLFIAAAGNSGADNDAYPFYPASFDLDNIIAVGNSTGDDELSSTSNYGVTSVDLAAPGTSIFSTDLGGGYVYGGGTSAAAPFVSGTCALLWAYEPGLTYMQVKSRILDRADHLPSLMGLVASARRLNAFNAINPSWVQPEPHVIIDSVTLSDPGGDGNGYFAIGETVEILPLLVNENFPDAVNVSVEISCANGNVTVLLPDTVSAGTLGGFAAGEPSAPLQLYLGSGLSRNEVVAYTLTVRYDPAYEESFDFSFVASPGDAYEPDNAPPEVDTIAPGATQNRSIHEIGDLDWAAFTLARTTEIKIETNGPGADDTELMLYGPGYPGTFLKYDDNSGAGRFSMITRTSGEALLPGTYYLKINEKGNDAIIADYTLALEKFNNPVAMPAAAPGDGFAPVEISFSNPGSYDPDGDAITGWEWQLGEETLSTSAAFVQTFDTPGIYQVNLRVKNIYGVWSAPAAVGITAWFPGDVDKSGTVDLGDFVLLKAAFGSTPGSPNWNPDADFDGSGVIDLGDFVILKNNFGESL